VSLGCQGKANIEWTSDLISESFNGWGFRDFILFEGLLAKGCYFWGLPVK